MISTAVCNAVGIFFIYWLFRYIVGPIIKLIFEFYVLTLPNNHVKIFQNSGKWAVVTGSTDGIGKEYCRQLAKIGLNVFLVGRDQAKLDLTSNELKRYYKIDVKYHKADFTSNTIYEELQDSLQNLDIGVLVNNVGMSLDYPAFFHRYDPSFSFMSKMINCNILSAVAMSKIVLPGMCDRKRGIIINISSISSIISMPLNCFYSSTKAFLTQFSQVMGIELDNSGVLVQTVLPSYVQTKILGNFRPPGLLTYSPEDYVHSAIKTVGIQSYTFGTIRHALQAVLILSVPKVVVTKFTALMQKRRYEASIKQN